MGLILFSDEEKTFIYLGEIYFSYLSFSSIFFSELFAIFLSDEVNFLREEIYYEGKLYLDGESKSVVVSKYLVVIFKISCSIKLTI